MAVQPWRTGIIIRIEDATYNTRRFWIKIPELESFDFKPGQFVTLDLPIDEKPSRRWRSYSIASTPDGSNVIELLIVLLEGGAGTNYLFNIITTGSEVHLRGPQGVFTLTEPIITDLYFICTGTGIAPFRSMLYFIKNKLISHKDIFLVFGTRTQNDLLYADEMRKLEKELEQFHFIPTLSRVKWQGKSGYVHEVYETIITQKKAGSVEMPPAEFYLCGWKNMIDEAKKRLSTLGYDKKSVHMELYG